MIGVGLLGGLGNQMFQYAAARAAAERLGCGLAVRGPRLRHRHAIPVLAQCLLPSLKGKARIHGEIGQVFPNATQSLMGIVVQARGESYRQGKFLRTFAAPRPIDASGVGIEMFDERYFEIKPHTWLTGFFQSRSYFADMEDHVSKWFELPHHEERVIQNIVRTWPVPAEQMAGIHVRRTDYLCQRDALSDPASGWALPIEYYTKAVRSVPRGFKFAVFSDDIEFAREHFGHLDPWLSPGDSPVRDMFLMSSCGCQVIANSSFSWWAAWLNRTPSKLIIAPRFHIGWRIKKWYPGAIKVDEWQYIDFD